MEVFKIYKNMDVTYAELGKVLHELGFKASSDKKKLRFFHEKSGSEVLLPLPELTDNDKIAKAFVASYSFALSEQGILEHPDDLLKLVEENRMKNLKNKGQAKAQA